MSTDNKKILYKPRDYQEHFEKAMFNGKRRAYLLYHRRAGKDFSCWCFMIHCALRDNPGLYYYCAPTYTQAKRIIWYGIDEAGNRLLNYIPAEYIKGKPNSTELRIDLTNGSIIQLVGSENYDALRGTNPKGVVFSEYAIQDPRCWNEVISPILLKNNGWAVFNTTPQGHNSAFELWQTAKHSDNWYTRLLTIDDTGLITKEQIAREIEEGKSQELIEQEYYCFPSGQFVMTSDGMRDISEIKPGMIVLSHTGRFRKVVETSERNFEGFLVRIKSYGSREDILCTPNHPIRVYERHSQNFRWIKAEHIKKKYRLFFPKSRFSGNYLSEDFIKMMAWYICEGSSGLNHIQFTVKNIEEAKYVSNICEICKYKTTIRQCETAVNVIINDTNLVDTLKSLCGCDAESKKIPLHLLGDNFKVFFYELMKGDGCDHENRGSRRISFTTISKSLAYQVQLLAHSLCLTAGIYTREAHTGNICGRSVNCKKSYVVQIGSLKIKQESTTLIRGKYGIGACVKDVSKEYFKGKVYNIKVQFDESYVVNGRAVHNCSFSRGIEGAYYGRLVKTLLETDRFCNVPYDTHAPVNTYWDIGINDSTVILLAQNIGKEVHIIDMYANQGEGLNHYANWIQKTADKKGYIYGKHYAPHDIQVRELGSGAKTRLETAKELGINFEIVPNLPISEGIELGRWLFPKLWVDKKNCKTFIKAAENYHKGYNEKLNVYSEKPVHDWSSDYMDSYRYMAIIQSVNQTSGQMTEQDADKMENKYSLHKQTKPSYIR